MWSRKLPPVRQAWPLEGQQRINFDASYEPVVMGKLMFLGSPNDGSVTAYDTETGVERWKFHTEGPVRCAPACWKGKVYAGSDDGNLYCLDAASGAVVWKFRGAPADRPDRRQIGNGHLVSFWPVRAGPVVLNDTVYFGAGLWSIFGVFIHALDAQTGKVKWTNDGLHYILTRAPPLDQIADTGVSPQGYLVAIGDRLVVANGRAMPAGLELATGKLIYYLQGARGGDSRVAAHGGWAFVGRDRMVNLYDFREAGCKWAYRGDQPPEGYYCIDDGYVWSKLEPGLTETLYLPYKTAEGCDAYSAFVDGVAYGAAKGTFYAYDLNKAKEADTEWPFYGRKVMAWKWEPPLLWQVKTPYAPQEGRIVIKAGKRLYGSAGKKLLALENLNGQARIAWEKDIEGAPSSLVAADNKLFVATAEGGIYCFGRKGAAAAAVKIYDDKPVALGAAGDAATKKAGQIVNASGVKSGYCLVLGLTNGHLVEELLKQTELLVIVADADAKKIDALRRRFAAAGLLGSRVELFTAKPFEFLFPSYIASLIVSEDAEAAGFSTAVDAAKLFEVLRPYGGTLCLELPTEERAKFEGWVKGAALANAKATQAGDWSLVAREGALPGSAPWSHEAADAARTLCSQDDLVRGPLGILWYGDMSGLIQWKANPNRPEVNRGAVYSIVSHAQSVEFWAYDAYTGRILWHTEMKNSTFGHVRNVAMEDGLYVAMDGKCYVLDSQTGKVQKTFTYNTTSALYAKDLRVEGEVIVVGCSDVDVQEVKGGGDAYWRQGFCESTLLVCLDRKTGAELWRRQAQDRFANTGLVMGAGLVFCVDSAPMWQSEKWKRRGAGQAELPSTVFALDARTGKPAWSSKIMYANKNGNDDWLAYAAEAGRVVGGRLEVVHAWDAKTGKPCWEIKTYDRGPMIVRGKTFIGFTPMADTRSSEAEYDIMTGKRTARQGALTHHRGGCNYSVGSRHLLTQREGSISYVDLDQGKTYYLRNMRSGCTNGLLVADGLLNAPNMGIGCVCSYSLYGAFAMVHMPEVGVWSYGTPLKATPPAMQERSVTLNK